MYIFIFFFLYKIIVSIEKDVGSGKCIASRNSQLIMSKLNSDKTKFYTIFGEKHSM